MTFYKELKKALNNKGEKAFVLVERNGGEYCDEYYCIFSPTKDSCGDYCYSGWWGTKKESKENIGRCAGYTEYEVNLCAREEDWRIVKTYSLKD